MIENLLENMLAEIGASHELFLLAAKKGLDSSQDKKYFEQLVACDNYLYFKSMMIKRNLQLEEQAFNLMQEKTGASSEVNVSNNVESQSEPQKFDIDPQWAEIKKLREAAEVDCAIQMSLAIEEEKKRIADIEEEELKKAIELSMNSHKMNKEEPSLFDPTTMKTASESVNKNPSVKSSINNKVYTNSSVFATSDKKGEIDNDLKITTSHVGVLSLDENKASKVDMPTRASVNFPKKTIEKNEKLQFQNKNEIPNPDNNLKNTILIENKVPVKNSTIKNKNDLDKAFGVDEVKPNLSSIKSMLQANVELNKEVAANVNQSNIELAKKYEEIEKEQQNMLKDYRDLVVKMKKEKRSVEKEKEDHIFEIDESQLSEDVKKRLQLRKSLADKLKNI